MQCECFCDGFGFLVVLWTSRREIWWTNWINRSIHLGAMHNTCSNAAVRCGSTAPCSLCLVVTSPDESMYWLDLFTTCSLPLKMLSLFPTITWLMCFYLELCSRNCLVMWEDIWKMDLLRKKKEVMSLWRYWVQQCCTAWETLSIVSLKFII